MGNLSGSKVKKIRRLIFLKDVFVIAISAFGGPAMHLALFTKRMVHEKKYLTEAELLEIYSLTQVLPGPSSTQTITCIGYKFGGAFLAFLTLCIWILPAFLIMTTLSFVFLFLDQRSTISLFSYIGPLVVALVTVSAIRMTKSVAKDKLSVLLILVAFLTAAVMRHPLENVVKTPWIFPVVLIFGGVVSFFVNREFIQHRKIRFNIPWRYLILWVLIFIMAGLLVLVTGSRAAILFENTYRFGSLVFGGGEVLIPMMLEQFVNSKSATLTHEEFMAGYALKQALPGPIFAITTFMTGLAMEEFGKDWHLFGCVIGTVGIFLPGTLLVFFVYPVWDQVKKFGMIQRSLDGVIAASAGLVVAAAYLLFLPVGLNWKHADSFYYTNLYLDDPVNWKNLIILAVLVPVLYRTKIPSPLLVLLAIVAGWLF